jgi:large repetitive protein
VANGTFDNFNVAGIGRIGTGVADNFNVNVVQAPQPSPPTNFAATPQNTGALVTWTAAIPGAIPVTGYEITATSTRGVLTYTTGNVTTAILASMMNDTFYTLSIVALASASRSTAAPPITVTPLAAAPAFDPADARVVQPAALSPDAPVQATPVPSDGSALASWTPGADGGAQIQFFTVTALSEADGTSTTQNAPQGSTSVVVSGLTNGVTYDFTVTATNVAGVSPASNMMTVAPAAGLPPVGDPAPDPTPAPPPDVPQPTVYAFPTLHLFRPQNFGLTPDQAADSEVNVYA